MDENRFPRCCQKDPPHRDRFLEHASYDYHEPLDDALKAYLIQLHSMDEKTREVLLKNHSEPDEYQVLGGSIYGFAYWFFRWSGMYTPVNGKYSVFRRHAKRLQKELKRAQKKANDRDATKLLLQETAWELEEARQEASQHYEQSERYYRDGVFFLGQVQDLDMLYRRKIHRMKSGRTEDPKIEEAIKKIQDKAHCGPSVLRDVD